MAREFRYEIKETFLKMETGASQTLELNLVSYNGAPAKWDLRRWQRVQGEEPKMLKGLTLTAEELGRLTEVLKGIQEGYVV